MMSVNNKMSTIFVVNVILVYCLTGNKYEENKFDAEIDRGNYDPTQQIKIMKK